MSFRINTLIVTRYATDVLTRGRYSAGTSSTFTIDASIHNIAGKELIALPEGRRDSEARKIFTSTFLNTVDAARADQVTIDGAQFEVVKKFDHTKNGVLPHYKYILSKVVAK